MEKELYYGNATSATYELESARKMIALRKELIAATTATNNNNAT
jgi:hypothetical protein